MDERRIEQRTLMNLNEYFEPDSIFRTDSSDDRAEAIEREEQTTNVNLDVYFEQGCIFRTDDIDYREAFGGEEQTTDSQLSREPKTTNNHYDRPSNKIKQNLPREGQFSLHCSDDCLQRGTIAEQLPRSLKSKEGRMKVSNIKGLLSGRLHTVGTFLSKTMRKSEEKESNERSESRESFEKGEADFPLVKNDSTITARYRDSSVLERGVWRSSEMLVEEKSPSGLLSVFDKFNPRLLSASKSKSMGNVNDIDNKRTSKRDSPQNNMKSTFKQMFRGFSPQRIVLRSEFVMIGQHGKHIGGMVATRDDSCWLFFRGGSEIARITHEGVTQEHLGITQAIDDLTMDDDENMYLSCPRSKKIKRIDTQGVVKTCIEPRRYPRCIAYNSLKKEILVCLNNSSSIATSNDSIDNNSVIRYANRRQTCSADFKIISHDSCRSLPPLSCPVRVCVDTQTADYVFSDFFERSIVIFDCNLKFRQRIDVNDLFESANLYCQPVICCDSCGRLFVFSKYSDREESTNCVVLGADRKVQEKLYLNNLAEHCIYSANFCSRERLLVASDNTVFVYEVHL